MEVYKSAYSAEDLERAIRAVPSIGENGNWYIGDLDTGVPATGAKGDKGDKGDTYVLTTADKSEIASSVLSALPTWNGGSY